MKRPLAFVGFSMAITLLVLNVVNYRYSKIIFGLAAALFAASLLINKLRQAKVAPFVFGAALLACLIFMVGYSDATEQKALDSHEAKTVFYIVDKVRESDGEYLYRVKTKSIDIANAPQNIKLKLYCEKKIDADYYEDLLGVIKYTDSYDNAFDSYGAYADKIYVSASLDSLALSLNHKSKPVGYYVQKVREYIKNTINLHLKNDVGALSLALLTGDKSLLSDKAYENFKTCGVTHIMAVSGLHTSVICLGFYTLLKNIGVKRNLRTLLSLLVLLFYMAITDFSVSVIRCSVMITTLIFARVVNKKADTLNSLGLAVAIICLNPFAVTDASAVLSVLSVLGMLSIKPQLDSRFKPEGNNKIIKYIYDGVSITLSVMITTFPAVWIFFANVGFVSYIANLIVIPLAQLAMAGSLLVSLLGFAKYICLVPAVLTYVPAKLMLIVTDFLASKLGFLNFYVGNKVFIISYCIILAFAGVSMLAKNKVGFKRIAQLSLTLIILASFIGVYDSCVNSYVDISPANTVAIYNSSAAVIVGANNKSDLYEVKRCLQLSNCDYVLFVDCKYDNEKLSALTSANKEFLNKCDFNIDLCDTLNVKYHSGIVFANVNGAEIEINDKYVVINQNLCYQRKTKYIYGNDDETVISIRK